MILYLFKGKGLFPHVLTKNQDFTVNFGQMPAPMRTLLAGNQSVNSCQVMQCNNRIIKKNKKSNKAKLRFYL